MRTCRPSKKSRGQHRARPVVLAAVGVAHQLDEWRRLARALGGAKSQAPKLAARA